MEFMNIGRVVRVKTKDGKVDWGLGFVVNFSNKSGKKKKKTESSFFIVDILVYIKKK